MDTSDSVAEDVLQKILPTLDHPSLLNCRLVKTSWKKEVDPLIKSNSQSTFDDLKSLKNFINSGAELLSEKVTLGFSPSFPIKDSDLVNFFTKWGPAIKSLRIEPGGKNPVPIVITEVEVWIRKNVSSKQDNLLDKKETEVLGDGGRILDRHHNPSTPTLPVISEEVDENGNNVLANETKNKFVNGDDDINGINREKVDREHGDCDGEQQVEKDINYGGINGVKVVEKLTKLKDILEEEAGVFGNCPDKKVERERMEEIGMKNTEDKPSGLNSNEKVTLPISQNPKLPKTESNDEKITEKLLSFNIPRCRTEGDKPPVSKMEDVKIIMPEILDNLNKISAPAPAPAPSDLEEVGISMPMDSKGRDARPSSPTPSEVVSETPMNSSKSGKATSSTFSKFQLEFVDKESRNKMIANPDYLPIPSDPEGYLSFQDFYPHYLGRHYDRRNRRLHVVGTMNTILLFVLGLITLTPILFLVGILQRTLCSFVGHWYFEKNRPVDERPVKNALYSVMGDCTLWWEVASGQRAF